MKQVIVFLLLILAIQSSSLPEDEMSRPDASKERESESFTLLREKRHGKKDYCDDNDDCNNQGICKKEMVGKYYESECVCHATYKGKYCEKDMCPDVICQNGGQRKLVKDDCQCDCPIGYGGSRCDKDYCNNKPCGRHGTCVPQAGGFTCKCQAGYSGKQCLAETCLGYDCGTGVCDIHKQTALPYCICPLGWSGNRCQTSPCTGAPTCVNGQHKLAADGKTCVCECNSKQWYGSRCQMKRVCDSTTCNNRGTCVPTTSTRGYRCDCLPGYTGEYCTQTVCAMYNCGSGVCNMDKSTNTPYCVCSAGWSGPNCETSPCAGAPTCVNGKYKLSGNGSSCVCDCPIGYGGSQCDIDYCYNNPCGERGTCVPKAGGYVCVVSSSCQDYDCGTGVCDRHKETALPYCVCPLGWSGKHCQTSPCTAFNCGSGVCNIDKNTNSPYCVCPAGRYGTNCQIFPQV